LNKKQKILTVVALVIFAGIIAGHYTTTTPGRSGEPGFYLGGGASDWYYLGLSTKYGLISDVRLPIFALAVFYVGLFFILRDARPGK
jgi:hypothetical protein